MTVGRLGDLAPWSFRKHHLDARHLISVVHIGGPQEAIEAVEAGATGIEHFATIQSLPDTLVAGIVAYRTFADPTFGELRIARRLAGRTAGEIERELRQKYEFVRRAYGAGALLTVGTDAPLVPFGTGFEDELAEYAKAGFTPAQILVFATRNNAAYLGKPGDLGKIASGYASDIVAVSENPLNDLRALHKPLWVMLAGQIVVGAKGWPRL